MAFYQDVLQGPLLALLVSAVVLAAALFLRLRGGAWGTLAVVAGCAAGYIGTLGLPPLPPREAVQRLFYLALATVAVGGALALLRWQGWRRGAVVFGLVLGGEAYLLLPRFAAEWNWIETATRLSALGLVGLAFWATLDTAAAHEGGVSFCVALLFVLGGTAAVSLFAHSALLAQLALVLLAALFPLLGMAWRAPSDAVVRDAMTVVAVMLAGLWLIGSFFGDFPTASILLLAAAPAAFSLAARASRFALLRLAVPLLLVGAGVALARPAAGPEDESSAYDAWTPSAVTNSNSGENPPAASVAVPASADDNNPFRSLEEPSPPP